MAIRTYQADLAGPRQMSVSDFAEITRSASRSARCSRAAAARAAGATSTAASRRWHRGGGHKRLYRAIDFRRDKVGVPGQGRGDRVRPEPLGAHRAAPLRDGEKRYILAPLGLEVGDELISGAGAEIRPGNTLPLPEHPARHRDPRRSS